MEIVSVTAENAADAGRIIFTSWNETYRGMMPEETLDGHTLEKCIARAEKFPETYRIAYVGKEAAGTVSFLCETRDFCSHRQGGEIVALYVLKKFQRQGIGKALLNEALSRIGQAGATLFVLKGNENAVGFYEKQGFKATGKEFHDTAAGITELEMFRE